MFDYVMNQVEIRIMNLIQHQIFTALIYLKKTILKNYEREEIFFNGKKEFYLIKFAEIDFQEDIKFIKLRKRITNRRTINL